MAGDAFVPNAANTGANVPAAASIVSGVNSGTLNASPANTIGVNAASNDAGSVEAIQGGIIRGEDGEDVKLWKEVAEKSAYARTNGVELEAIYYGLIPAQKRGVTSLIAQVDSANVVNMLAQTTMRASSLQQLCTKLIALKQRWRGFP